MLVVCVYQENNKLDDTSAPKHRCICLHPQQKLYEIFDLTVTLTLTPQPSKSNNFICTTTPSSTRVWWNSVHWFVRYHANRTYACMCAHLREWKHVLVDRQPENITLQHKRHKSFTVQECSLCSLEYCRMLPVIDHFGMLWLYYNSCTMSEYNAV